MGEYCTAILKTFRIIIISPKCFTLTAWKIAIRTDQQMLSLKSRDSYLYLVIFIFIKIFEFRDPDPLSVGIASTVHIECWSDID
jgi:hypothetical protein